MVYSTRQQLIEKSKSGLVIEDEKTNMTLESRAVRVARRSIDRVVD